MAIRSAKTKVEVVRIKESNELSRASVVPAPRSNWDERVIVLVTSKITKDEEDGQEFQEHVIPFEELTGGKLSTRQYSLARSAVDYVSHSVYRSFIGRRGHSNYPIFHHLEIDDDGNIRSRLNEGLKKHFFDLKREYTLLSLPEFMALSTIYAQQMYRLLRSCKSLSVARIDLIDMHEFLQVPASFRANFAEFKRRVLEPASKELNTKTSLKYSYKPISKGRGGKVMIIEFTFQTTATLHAPASVDPADIVTPEQMKEDIEKLKREGFGSLASALAGIAGIEDDEVTTKTEQRKALKRTSDRQMR